MVFAAEVERTGETFSVSPCASIGFPDNTACPTHPPPPPRRAPQWFYFVLAFNNTAVGERGIRCPTRMNRHSPPTRRNREINLEHNRPIVAPINRDHRKRAFEKRPTRGFLSVVARAIARACCFAPAGYNRFFFSVAVLSR